MATPEYAPQTLVRPWRTAAIVAAAIAALELAILVVVGLALAGRLFTDEVERKKETAVVAAFSQPISRLTERQAVAELSRAETRVTVLNGSGRQGAAAATAERLQGRGYRIEHIGNAERTTFARSVVMYRTGFRGEAERLAHDIRLRHATPLDGIRPREAGRAHVVVVVG